MQEKRFVIGSAEVHFWMTENICDCINNVELIKGRKTVNIKEITGEYLGKQPDELYTQADERDGMLAVSTFRGIRFFIDTEALTLVKREICK